MTDQQPARQGAAKHSYCETHKTHPLPGEPCWQCANPFILAETERADHFANALAAAEADRDAAQATGGELFLALGHASSARMELQSQLAAAEQRAGEVIEAIDSLIAESCGEQAGQQHCEDFGCATLLKLRSKLDQPAEPGERP